MLLRSILWTVVQVDVRIGPGFGGGTEVSVYV